MSDSYGLAAEPEDVPVHQIFLTGAVIFGSIAVAVIVLFQIYNKGVQTASLEAAAEYVAFPQIRDGEVAGMRKITQYEVVDQAAGVYAIPIERAMEIVAAERAAQGDAPTMALPGE